MRKHFSNLTLLCGILLAASCKKTTEVVYVLPNHSSKDDLAALFKDKAGSAEKFTINATTGGKFTSSKGITYTVDPGIFVKSDGTTVQGNVEISVKEITEVSDMILNDKPTNALLNNPKDTLQRDQGAMLNSFGEFKVDAKQGAEELELKPNAEIKVEIPQTAVPEPILTSMPLWSSLPEVQILNKGHDYENQVVTEENIIQKNVQTGIQWVQTPQVCTPQETVVNNITMPSLSFGIDAVGEWRNCDVLVTVSIRTTVLGYFTNVFNDSSNTDSYAGLQPNMLFFKKKGDNVLVKLYNNILNAPEGKKGLLSYQNSFGIGMEGTFLALVQKNGKYYAQKKAVTIGTPESGKNYVGVFFTLQEVSKEEMFALINSMDQE